MFNSTISTLSNRLRSSIAARAAFGLLAMLAALTSAAAPANAQGSTGTGSVTLTVTADSYVHDNKSAGNNYGTNGYMLVRSGTLGNNEHAYMQFNTASLSTNIVSATIYVYGYYNSSVTNGSELIQANGAANTPTWTESGLTWNDAPAITTAGGTNTVTETKGTYGFDITSYMRSQAASGQALSTIVLTAPTANSYVSQFYTKENSEVDEAYVVVTYGTVPAAPALTGAAGNSQATLTWTAPSGATSYNLYRSTTSGTEGTTPYKTGVTSPYTDTGLTNGSTYYYKVTALDAVGEGTASNEVAVTPSLPPAVPAAPSNVSAVGGPGIVTVSWSAVTGATSYNVKRSLTNGGPYTTLASITSTSYVDNTVPSGTTAYYVVSAVNQGGESSNSSQVSAAPTTALPVAPTNLVASGSNEKVILNWTQSPTAVTYDVERGTAPGGPYTIIAEYVTGSTYTDYSVANNQPYYYVLAAVNSVGTGSYSNEAAALPSAVYTLTAIAAAGVRDNSYASTALGTHDGMWTKTTKTDNRYSLIKFDMSQVLGTVTAAHLRVYGYHDNTSTSYSVNDSVFPVLSDTWTQTGVTWNTKPAIGTTSVGSTLITDNKQYYDWDITSYVQSKLAAGATLADVALEMTATPADNDYNQYNSLAATSNLPLLVVTTATPAINMQVNFQPASSAVPAGWVADTGEPFSAATGMGWVAVSSLSSGYHLPLNLTPNTVDRKQSGVAAVNNTVIYMQYPTDTTKYPSSTAVRQQGAWDLQIPNGTYNVEIGAGDIPNATYGFDSDSVINANGSNIVGGWVGSASNYYTQPSTTVTVTNGLLTIDPIGGTNAKMDFAVISNTGVAQTQHPYITTSLPLNGATGVYRNAAIQCNIDLVNPETGIDLTTLNNTNVQLIRDTDNTNVAGQIITSGAEDTVVFQPNSPLSGSTQYTFNITPGLKDTDGITFTPYTITFTTGTASSVTTNPAVSFVSSIVYPTAGADYMKIGPDHKLYATFPSGDFMRFTIASDGTLTLPETFTGFEGRNLMGFAFDPDNPNLIWVVNDDPVYPQPATDFTGKISKLLLSGSGFDGSVQDYIVGLPRSGKDHMTNSVAFGPDGLLYCTQGADTAGGAADATWYNRTEHLLSAAVLQIDPTITTGLPINVQTDDYNGTTGTYNPYAASAPVRIYGDGVRNAFDLVWHTNGHLYCPTNGTSAAGDTPGSPDGTVPAIINCPVEDDYLYDIVPGEYYGHPNPSRGDYVLDGGNPTSGVDPAEVVNQSPYSGYPVGVMPESNWGGFAWDYGQHNSADGSIEYMSNTFGGALKGDLLTCEYSVGQDIIALAFDTNGKPTSETQVVSGLENPLDLCEDTNNGDLYVTEYPSGSFTGQIMLLRPNTPVIAATPSPMEFQQYLSSGASAAQTLTITNNGLLPLTLSAGGITVTGTNASQFTLSGMPTLPLTLASGQTTTVKVAYAPSAAGLAQATISIASNDPANPILAVPVSGVGIAAAGVSADEPDLQELLNAYNIDINAGSETPATGATGDEVLIPRFQKASTGSVTITPLAEFGPTDPATGLSGMFGWYKAGQPNTQTLLYTVSNAFAQTLNVSVNGTTSFDPGTQRFGMYVKWPHYGWSTYQEDALNTFKGALPHQVRIYPLKDSTGVAVPNAYVMAWKCSGSNYLYNDAIYIIRNVKPAQGYLASKNLDGFPSNSWLSMNEVGDAANPSADVYHSTSTLQLTNTQPDPITITSAQITGPFSFASTVAFPSTLASGQSLQLPVTFNATSGRVSTGSMIVQTTAPDELRIPVTLSGYFQIQDQDGLEPSFAELVNGVFGFTTNIGVTTYAFPGFGSIQGFGDEVLSGYWQQASASTPITVRQIAAWSAPHETNLWWYAKGATTQLNGLLEKNADESQSLLPHLDGSTTQTAYATLNTTSTFGFKSDTEWSDDNLNYTVTDLANGATPPAGHHMRFYAVSDQNGNLVPNAYIMGMDYSGGPNYDYQDNMYYITGIKPASEDLTAYVNPFIGTGTGTTVIGGTSAGGTFPGADTPFGMVQLSPDTTTPNSGGYNYSSTQIVGFSHTHMSGAGAAFFGDIALMPTLGAVTNSSLSSLATTFSHSSETAKPGYYEVALQSSAAANVTAELTASPHVGWQRYTFPASQQANVIVNLTNSFRGIAASTINIIDANDVEGSVTSYGPEESSTINNTAKPYTVYFHTHFDQPITSYGTWSAGTLTVGSATATGTAVAAYLSFGTPSASGFVVDASTALSYVSLTGARDNYAAEAPNAATFNSIEATATAQWNTYLHRVEITASTVASRNTFYTALYHSMLFPSLYSDADGTYLNFNGAVKQATGINEYTNFSMWDTYRTEHPLLALVAPEVDHDMVESLMDVYSATGYLPRWTLANMETNDTVGDSVIPILVDAYEKGVLGTSGYTPAQVYAAALNNATNPAPSGYGFDGRIGLASYLTNGYVPYISGSKGANYHYVQGASETMEYSMDDGMLSQLATAVGDTSNASLLQSRGKNYQKLYSPTNGFITPILSSGTFLTPFDPTTILGFYESSAWQMEWMAPQDPYGMIALNGGAATTGTMLDSLFQTPELLTNPTDVLTNKWSLGAYYNPTDEPDLGAPYLYTYLGQPYKTPIVVRAAESLYNTTPTGIPGNDDLGEMSAWYVMSALGIYPYAAGSPNYVLTAPLLPSAVIHLNTAYTTGSAITIAAPGANANTQYVQSLTDNGVQLNKAWISHTALTSGTTLNYTLGSSSSTWATASSSLPPTVVPNAGH